MTLKEFRSLPTEPTDLSPSLRALWQDAAGRWDAAHHRVQDDNSSEAAWVHAYLHRKEGDIDNAGYWYSRAGKPQHSGSLDDEWQEIVQALLS